MPDFHALPLAVNAFLFIALAGGIWIAGRRLAQSADEIAQVTGFGQAVTGMLLLGGITSLPEVAVTVPVSMGGDAELAVNNLLGGIAFQVVVIAVGDALLRRRAITGTPADPPLLLQPAACTLLLCIVAAGVVVGEIAILGVGAWSIAVLLASIAAFLWIARQKGREEKEPTQHHDCGLVQPLVMLAIAAAVLIGLGWMLAQASEALISQTGLQSGFFGFVFLAIATSLPEISTVAASVRLGRPNMALGDIFGTNVFDIALIFLVDVVYDGGPVLGEVGTSSVLAALLGAIVTLVYLLGLVERRDPVLGRLGLDSVAVLAVYAVGAVLLYGSG